MTCGPVDASRFSYLYKRLAKRRVVPEAADLLQPIVLCVRIQWPYGEFR
uniref:Uncharacterized protein n=1 Tax=Romanomermis culicivorax TaxID=13658 RepID=A0A915JEF2_ROMCU